MVGSAPSSVSIRVLAPGDAGAFTRWRGRDDGYTRAIAAEHLTDYAAGRRCILVAATADALVGTAQLVREHPEPDLANGSDIGYVEAVEVIPAYRRQGIATRMMAALEQCAASLGIGRLTIEVEPDNAPAISLYLLLGYSEFRRGVWRWRGAKRPTICMAKGLTAKPELTTERPGSARPVR